MNTNKQSEKADYISRCLELAILFEVSGYPKPGNVHRTADFANTSFEHYLASAVGIRPTFKKAAEKGIMVLNGEIHPFQIEIGNLIKEAVNRMIWSQNGGNTLFGAIIILMPIAVGAGMIDENYSLLKLRKNIQTIVESTTVMDAIEVYDSINLANPGGLNKSEKYDAKDPKSKEKLLNDGVTLLDTFKIALNYDSIASEWVKNYPITFDLGYPYFINQLEKTKSINTAIVHTFLKILAEIPDTFISRKVGKNIAEKVSIDAENVLKEGGLTTSSGRKLLDELDKKVRDKKNDLSPGTTADLTEAVLALNNLNGYKP